LTLTSSGEDSLLEILTRGEITLKGKFLWGSNYTFLVEVSYQEVTLPAVYKPSRGERPLWDFPTASLAHREVAAYLVSEALGWRLVPETVYRRTAPLGPGSLQRYIEHDPEYHYFNLNETDRQRLRPVVLFDLLVNNADRKGGHVILDADQHIWLIDHGICFHVEDKLRTVIWDFAGQPIPPELLAALRDFQRQLAHPSKQAAALRRHLSAAEMGALAARAEHLLSVGSFPGPDSDRRPYPWPPL
jgi:hypothetical protein